MSTNNPHFPLQEITLLRGGVCLLDGVEVTLPVRLETDKAGQYVDVRIVGRNKVGTIIQLINERT